MPRTPTLSLEEKNLKIQRLATYDVLTLETMRVDQLRELLRGLVRGISKMKKSVLIERSLEVTENYRTQTKLDLATKQAEIDQHVDIDYPILLGIYKTGTVPEKAAELIYARVSAKKYKDSTIKSNISKNIRDAMDLVKFDYPKSLKWCESTYSEYLKLIKDITTKVNKEYKDRIDNRTAEDCKSIDGDMTLTWATELIEWAAQQDNLKRGWHKVSFALAMTSGRRQSEIHGTTTYKLVDSAHIEATGLAKKQDPNNTLIFKPLVPAELWIKAFSNLPEERKNQSGAKINGTIRKAIWDSIGSKMLAFGFTKYHDSRDFYINYHIDRFYDRTIHVTEVQYVAGLVGHESNKTAPSYLKMHTLKKN